MKTHRTDDHMFTHSVKPGLPTVYEGIESKYRARPQWMTDKKQSGMVSSMRRVPTMRAIDACRIIEAGEALVKMKRSST